MASIAGIAILYKKEQDKEEKLVKADTESIRQIQKLSSLSVFPACLLPHPFLLILSPIPATMNYFTSKALFERTDSTFLHLSLLNYSATLSVKNGALVGLGTAFIAHVGAGIILSGIQFEQGFFTRAFAIFGFSLVFVGVCTIPSAALAGSGIFYYLQNKQKERESINQD